MTTTDETRDALTWAEQELELASRYVTEGRYVSARLTAQLCAERALSALGPALGGDGHGHGVVRLVHRLPGPVDKGLLRKARFLDSVFVSTQDPAEDTPKLSCRLYGSEDCGEAIRYAGDIIEFVRACLGRQGSQDGLAG